MKAIVITRQGGPEVLEIREVPTPEPRGDQVRVRVRACGLNRADLMQSRGNYPAPPGSPADIPGLEFAGEVDALGPDVTGPLKAGDRVFGIVGGGGQAEYVVTHERMAVPIPANLDFDAAAAVPEVFVTAHDALETRAGVRPGERVLVHAVGGGVGSAAVQLAHAMGCTVFGTSRTASKLREAAALGLDVGIESPREDVADVVRQRTGGAGVDVIIDLLGAAALAANLAALAMNGRLVLVGLLGGGTATLEMAPLMRKRLTVVATTLRARPLEEKIAATRRFAHQVVPWLERGLVRPVIDRVFPFGDVRAAQDRLESNLGFGKVILRL
ncbi:MAG: NAD(P)H-quinone oxidoreductase [Planctomycetaceae bacterium]|nr:NAD(P)H-quinone oxidoreductase [Planctomycetaceae bacterium]